MKKEKNSVSDFMLHVAQGFYDIGYNAANNVETDNSIKGFQRLPSAVVNFNFAVELMLKALNLLTSGKNLQGHEIWKLFKNLPQETQLEIEAKFLEYKKLKNVNLSSYQVKVTKGNNETKSNKDIETLSLKEFLILHNHSFQNWRYLYEVNEKGYDYAYDFKLMNDFIKALIEIINKIREGKGPMMLLKKV